MNVEEVVPPDFTKYGLEESILKALNKMGFKHPSPIQEQTISVILEGKDLIALAQTGSGKTAACSIPVCQIVDHTRIEIQALIIVPTRELALQYSADAQKIGIYKGVKTFAICGGEDASLQQSKIRSGVQVLVATPGRLIDFIYSRQIDLSHVKTLILDEADEMLGMGFYEDLDFIMQCLVHPHQTLLFSATMPAKIKEMAKTHMKEPLEVNLIHQQASPDRIEHFFVYCQNHHREERLLAALEELNPKQSIIFCHSRFQVEKVTRFLRTKLEKVDFIHAGLTQDVRSIVTNKFRQEKIRFLVATDIVARGLDFSKVSHVFIYQLPADPEVYVHRSGRTGRYDKEGVVVSFVTDREMHLLNAIMRQIEQKPVWMGSPPPERPPSKHKKFRSFKRK